VVRQLVVPLPADRAAAIQGEGPKSSAVSCLPPPDLSAVIASFVRPFPARPSALVM